MKIYNTICKGNIQCKRYLRKCMLHNACCVLNLSHPLRTGTSASSSFLKRLCLTRWIAMVHKVDADLQSMRWNASTCESLWVWRWVVVGFVAVMVDLKASETTVASERRESKAQQEVLRLDSCFCCFLQVYTDRTSVYTVYVALMGTRHTNPHHRTPILPTPTHRMQSRSRNPLRQ